MSSRASFDIKTKIYDILRAESERRMTAREIAQEIEIRYPEDCKKKISRASVDFSNYSFQDQLVAEIGSVNRLLLKKFPEIKATETRPRQYYYSELSEDVEANQTEVISDDKSTKFSEHDLYPLLGKYLWNSDGTLSMRVDERRSTNRRGAGGNRWLFPDIVGMLDLTKSWERIAVEAAKSSGAERAMLSSYEVKLRLNTSNTREAFFQTLSNSSWAHFSYLVALEISEDAMLELRLLSSAHGIGFILLDGVQPNESQILIPARGRSSVDWNLLNRLAGENSDAKKYLKLVRDFHLTGESHKSGWDLAKSL